MNQMNQAPGVGRDALVAAGVASLIVFGGIVLFWYLWAVMG